MVGKSNLPESELPIEYLLAHYGTKVGTFNYYVFHSGSYYYYVLFVTRRCARLKSHLRAMHRNPLFCTRMLYYG